MKSLKVTVLVIIFGAMIASSGCSNTVRGTVSRSEFVSKEPKINKKVALHLTDDFRNYKNKHVDWWCDATSYTMEVGVLASDWFQYAFEERFENTIIDYDLPEFPYSEPQTDFVITPEFTSFKAGGPVVIKLENYWVELGMKVTIQDVSGETIEVLELKEKGAQGGTPGFNPGTHVYPEVCRKAVKPLADKTLEKIIELSN